MASQHAIGLAKAKGDVSNFSVIEVPLEQPKGIDVLVNIKAVSVNPVDTKARSGSRQGDSDFKAPLILGYDASGVVEAVGPDVTKFKKGDEVYYAGSIARNGTNTQYHLVDSRLVGFKPKKLTHAQAAALPLVTITAWEGMLEQMHIPNDGETKDKTFLMINSAGGVGSVALYLASKVLKFKNVIGTASRPETVKWAKKFGATHTINHHDPLKPQLEKLGLKADYIFVGVDLFKYTDQIFDIINPFGHIVAITGAKPVDMAKSFHLCLSLSWEFMFAKAVHGVQQETQGQLLDEMAKIADSDPLLAELATETLPFNLENLRKAHELVESGKAMGKVTLDLEQGKFLVE